MRQDVIHQARMSGALGFGLSSMVVAAMVGSRPGMIGETGASVGLTLFLIAPVAGALTGWIFGSWFLPNSDKPPYVKALIATVLAPLTGTFLTFLVWGIVDAIAHGSFDVELLMVAPAGTIILMYFAFYAFGPLIFGASLITGVVLFILCNRNL